MSTAITSRERPWIPWIGLFCIAAIYVFSIVRFDPSHFFGATQDDALYFTSAKALANHQGYILPSVPSGPAARKYPILYPWLLSWVWRLNPSFPSNLKGAVGLTVAFGVIFLVASFLFFRRLRGSGDLTALALTLFVALHPMILYYSAGILSDVPFAALALVAMLMADGAMQPASSAARTTGCALLTGLSILMRAFGIPVAAGILAAALMRRAWRQAAIYCGVLVPFAVAVVWRWIFVPPAQIPSAASARWQTGYANVWAYYMSYAQFWKLSVPNVHILWAMLRSTAILIIHSPSDYFLAPLLTRRGLPALCLALVVTAGIFAGLARESRGGDRKSIHWVLPFYMLLILVWNFPNTERFSLLFLPLFAAGLWFETKHFLGTMYGAFNKSQTRTEKAFAATLAFCVMAAIGALGWNYWRGARPVMADLDDYRSGMLAEKREAYDWIVSQTSPQDIIIAYEDVSLYLYTDRQSFRPVVFPTSGEFDPAYIHEALTRITDVGHVLGARYWLISDDDFDLEWEQAGTLGRERERKLEASMPEVFKSRDGRVRIYRLGCDDDAEVPLCLHAN